MISGIVIEHMSLVDAQKTCRCVRLKAMSSEIAVRSNSCSADCPLSRCQYATTGAIFAIEGWTQKRRRNSVAKRVAAREGATLEGASPIHPGWPKRPSMVKTKVNVPSSGTGQMPDASFALGCGIEPSLYVTSQKAFSGAKPKRSQDLYNMRSIDRCRGLTRSSSYFALGLLKLKPGLPSTCELKQFSHSNLTSAGVASLKNSLKKLLIPAGPRGLLLTRNSVKFSWRANESSITIAASQSIKLFPMSRRRNVRSLARHSRNDVIGESPTPDRLAVALSRYSSRKCTFSQTPWPMIWNSSALKQFQLRSKTSILGDCSSTLK
mmetsp:Transcript_5405/g.13512  ORF Transcript_5405/g.13512 Transcript_5405/m.13512 type:complete len:322 (-) Transcript_5405:141-1106(-)